MTFLVSILASLIEWLLSKIFSFGVAKAQEAEKNASIVKQSQADAQEVKDAKTDEDRSKAAADLVNHTFGN